MDFLGVQLHYAINHPDASIMIDFLRIHAILNYRK